MKLAWWLLAALVVLITAIMAVPSPAEKSKNYPQARDNVTVLAGLPGIEHLGQGMSCVSIIRPSVGNLLRELVGMDAHGDPLNSVEHRFRNADGRFSVQLTETKGKVHEVIIYGDPSSGLPPGTMATLKPLFPDADYHAKP